VIGELALAMIPLTAAGLMLRSLWVVRSEGAVLTPHRVLTARIESGSAQDALAASAKIRESDQLLAEIESLPGVRAATLWSVTFGFPARISGLPQREDAPVAMWFNVSPRYREAAGVRLLAGQWFTERDRSAQPPVVVVSERFARTFSADFPNPESLVGRTTFGPFAPPEAPDREAPMTIIGVASDFRSGRFGILQPDDANALPQVFFLDVLRPMAGGELLVRTASSPVGLLPSIRNVVHSRPGARLMAVGQLDAQLAAALTPRSFNTLLIAAFATIALLLTALGVSGVIRYAVAQRTREIGLRVAVGARQADILRTILAQTVVLVVAGVAIGVGVSAAISKVISGVLYGVTPTDPTAYVSAAILLVAVALGAAYAPARRATHLDPMVALRQE
jgi:hypothetical protein